MVSNCSCPLAPGSDCERLLLHGGSFLGASTPHCHTGCMSRPAGSRHLTFQQLEGHRQCPIGRLSAPVLGGAGMSDSSGTLDCIRGPPVPSSFPLGARRPSCLARWRTGSEARRARLPVAGWYGLRLHRRGDDARVGPLPRGTTTRKSTLRSHQRSGDPLDSAWPRKRRPRSRTRRFPSP